MHLQMIDMPERDKLAAGYGLVSDVFEYYPKGVTFPIFVDDTMQKVSVIPDGESYFVFPSYSKNKSTGIRGSRNSLFSDVVDHAKDLLTVPEASKTAPVFELPLIAQQLNEAQTA